MIRPSGQHDEFGAEGYRPEHVVSGGITTKALEKASLQVPSHLRDPSQQQEPGGKLFCPWDMYFQPHFLILQTLEIAFAIPSLPRCLGFSVTHLPWLKRGLISLKPLPILE